MSATGTGLAYASLNLRKNPFGEPLREERAAFALVDVEPLVEWLAPGRAIQFLGESGRGKTTHLLALHARFPHAPFVTFLPGATPSLPEGPILFLDEMQRLSPRKRKRLFRGLSCFAIGSHEDHASELASAGIQVKTIQLSALEPNKLYLLIERRIEWARRGPGPVPAVGPEAVQALLARHGSDLRAMESELYELFQRLGGSGRVEL